MEELKLHDIKGLVEIPDDSIYYFYGLISLLIIVLLIVSVLLYRYLRREKTLNLQKHYMEQLKALDFDTPKESAYLFTHYGELLEKSPEQEELFKTLIPLLDAYKYKKEVPSFDEETLAFIQNFLDAMNV